MAKHLGRVGEGTLALVCALLFTFSTDLAAVMPERAGKFTGGWPASDLNPSMESLRFSQPTAELRGVHGQVDVAARSSPVRAGAESTEELFANASLGTAWTIAPGFVVTNNHVIAGSTAIILISMSGEQLKAWPVIRDELNDLALLEVSDSNKLPAAIPLANSQARPGSHVFTVGFPRVDILGATPKVSDGVISGINGLRSDPSSYQTTVGIQPGNSGGPLLNMNGEVVGVVKSMVGIRDEANGKVVLLRNASSALKVECLKELIGMLPRQNLTIDSLPSHSDVLETLASRIRGSVMIVVAR
jgi:S1-C subfamily serine protease